MSFSTIDPDDHNKIDDRLRDVLKTANGMYGSLDEEVGGMLASMYPPEADQLGDMAERLEAAAAKLREMQDELDPDLTDKQAAVLRALQKNTGQTCQELGDRVGSTASLVGKIYRDLARKGLVRFEDNKIWLKAKGRRTNV